MAMVKSRIERMLTMVSPQGEGKEQNVDQEVGAIRRMRTVKPNYPFTPKQSSLLAEGRDLAKAYGISFNQLLTFLLENAVQEWTVPFMAKREKRGEEQERPENEGLYG